MSSSRVVSLDKSHGVAVAGSVLVVVFRAGPTDERVTSSWDAGIRQIVNAGGKPIFFGLIEEASDPPNDAGRKAFSRFFEKHRDILGGFFVAVAGTGFRAAMVRTVISTIMNVLPRFRFSFPRHVTATVEEAAALAERVSPGLDGGALLATVRNLQKGQR